MKKVILLFIAVLLMSNVNGQDITDAVRYSIDEIEGTARFKAMGGAFGALGGDLSAININPAGSSIFTNSHASISLGVFGKDNTVSFFNTTNSSTDTNADLNQGGAVFVFQNANPNSKWKKFSLGIAYDRTGNFDDDWVASGINPTNTIGQYFEEFANGQRLDEISALDGETIGQAYSEIGSIFGFGNQQAFLGFESFILDPVNNSDDNTEYINNITGGNYNQRYFLSSTGFNGKLGFNVSGQYGEKIHLGLNVNTHFLNYERSTLLIENNSNIGSLISRVGFENNLRATGSGVSFQLGTIIKVTNELRLGLAYNSPTWFRISEETSQSVETTRRLDPLGPNPFTVIDPNVINIFPEYRLQTPGKLTGSLAYVFGSRGLLSFDYSRKDFGEAKFRPQSDPFFQFQNDQIENVLDVSNTYRLGGEYRYKQMSFRGGYRMEESPYKDDSFFGDLTGYSLGFGYKFGNTSLDLAFSQSEREVNTLLFSNSSAFTDAAEIDTTFTDVVLTLAFSL
ncbi:OmpP1/FadL family transporter [Winogradskyella immobilis]|uniref:Outer membrane protein transport protein n=1 Tax=Winogradskyella immobilis TaxID=2816852 RepID=A0ABS8EP91_9FLAO|nr:outer membrane protein transport protein [Winogradskyella immobilis]MCC1485029.1 outer membrane protein transport protein [Winogradskyella immobilis]MCG0017121.1 transporter [Winogradskyella immobilis]